MTLLGKDTSIFSSSIRTHLVLSEQVVQRGAAHPEELCCLRQVAPGLSQSRVNDVALGLSPGGALSLFTQRGTHLVVDVVGWSS